MEASTTVKPGLGTRDSGFGIRGWPRPGACALGASVAIRTTMPHASNLAMTQGSYAQPSAPSDPDPRAVGPDPRTSAPPPPRTALITGASSGIGASFADVFAAHGFDLVIVARREDRLRDVAARLEGATGLRVHVIACDLARRETPAELCQEIASRGLTIDALVNNAGYGVPGTFLASPWERHEAMLQVMVGGLTQLTYRLLP